MNPRNVKLNELKAQARENGKKVKRGEMTYEDAVMRNSSNVFTIETDNPDLIESPDSLIRELDLITEENMN